jgi:hypothetical protein
VNARNAITQSLAPVRATYAVLYDARTGSRTASVRVAPDGTYAFTALDDGAYFVFAGEDEAADAMAGVPGRRWGAFGGGPTRPSEVSVTGAGTYPASISAGWPSETEPNDGLATAGRLVNGGYVQATLSSAGDVDVFTITLPAGQYVFDTSAWDGACGYALEADTELALLGTDGLPIAANDDIGVGSFCSRLARTLSAGAYYLRVTGAAGGRYRLAVRGGG